MVINIVVEQLMGLQAVLPTPIMQHLPFQTLQHPLRKSMCFVLEIQLVLLLFQQAEESDHIHTVGHLQVELVQSQQILLQVLIL
ncbi:hypothetical protein D3C80_1240550 [compost metagenome]